MSNLIFIVVVITLSLLVFLLLLFLCFLFINIFFIFQSQRVNDASARTRFTKIGMKTTQRNFCAIEGVLRLFCIEFVLFITRPDAGWRSSCRAAV